MELISLRISENLIELRRNKGITQDELASFLGVTKASVSKWETKQSYPDILLIPQLATFFGISIDELLGYEPQLSNEQIKKLYHDLAAAFSNEPFEDVIKKSKALVKEYYTCYPLLYHIAVLWINHFTLESDLTIRNQLLSDMITLCDHITAECKDLNLCRNTIVIASIAHLNLGHISEVIESLEPLNDPQQSCAPSDTVLIEAYMLSGEIDRADQFNQVALYTHLQSLITLSISLINLHLQDKEYCQRTIERIQTLISLYEIDKLNPNMTLQFHFQAAIYYAMHQDTENALNELNTFVTGTIRFLRDGVKLHGDSYFTRLNEWIEKMDMNSSTPRSIKIILESTIQSLEIPSFSDLSELEEFKQLKLLLKKEVMNYDTK